MSCNKFDVLITCEHAGNAIPAEYASKFQKHSKLIKTHRGYDIGAYDLAKKLSKKASSPLFFQMTTRLLVDVNRSLSSRSLFFLPLTETEKKSILFYYYLPYRQKVTNWIGMHNTVLHLSIHSFTPVLNGVERMCDIGLLYDPKRKNEKAFCQILTQHIQSTSDFIVRSNYPYKGVADGFTTSLRKEYQESRYCGIEIEVNQKLLGTTYGLASVYKALAGIFS